MAALCRAEKGGGDDAGVSGWGGGETREVGKKVLIQHRDSSPSTNSRFQDPEQTHSKFMVLGRGWFSFWFCSRLRELLELEERSLLAEMEALEETAEERQGKMRERAKFLREKREKERQQLVAEKREQQFRYHHKRVLEKRICLREI